MNIATLPPPDAAPRASAFPSCTGARLRLLPSGGPTGRTRAASGALLRVARGLEPDRAVVLDFVLDADPDRPLSVEIGLDGAAAGEHSARAPGRAVEAEATPMSDVEPACAENAVTRFSGGGAFDLGRAPSDEDARIAAGLRSAAALALPGLEPAAVTPAEAAAGSLGRPIRLRPASATPIEFAAALRPRPDGADPRADAVSEPTVQRVALAHPRATAARLAHALHVLAGLDHAAALRVRLAAVRLDAADLRPIGLTARTLGGHLDDVSLPPHERAAVAAGLARLEAWRSAGAGVAAEISVLTEEPLEPWLLGVLGEALFGVAAEDDRAFETDLTLAAPEGAPSPVVLPSAGALAALARHRAERLRRGRRTASAEGAPIGMTDADRVVRLSDAVRSQGLYVTGATGTGKTTLLANLVRRDLRDGRGVCVVDPHGDLFAELRDGLDAATRKRAMIADLADEAGGFSLNLLEPEGRAPARHRNFVCNQLIGAFGRIYRGCPESMGPMFEAYFRNAVLLLMEAEGESATLLELDRVFVDAKWRREALERCGDESVARFWRGIALKAGGDASLENIAPYIVSKLTQFTGNPALRPVLCRPRSTLDFGRAMAEGRPCLVNLAKGAVGEADASLMGALIVTKLFAAAMRRAEIPQARRRPFRVYLDEFQGYATDLLGSMLAEGRKFGLEPTLANQSLSQIDGRNRRDDVAHAVLANCASIVAFRSGPTDAALLAAWLGTDVAPRELSELANRRALARLGDPAGPPRLERIRTLVPR